MWTVASTNQIILAVAFLIGLAIAFWAFRGRRGRDTGTL